MTTASFTFIPQYYYVTASILLLYWHYCNCNYDGRMTKRTDYWDCSSITTTLLHCVSYKIVPLRQVGMNLSKLVCLKWFFTQCTAIQLRIHCAWKVWYVPSTSCTVSMATRADLLRSGPTWNRRLWTRPLTSGGNDSKPGSRPKDNILNICCNFSRTCRLLVPTFFWY